MAEAMLDAAQRHVETGEMPAYGLAHLFALNNDASGAAAYLQLALERYEGDVFDLHRPGVQAGAHDAAVPQEGNPDGAAAGRMTGPLRPAYP